MELKTVRLVDIARLERAVKGKIYPAGSILIQVSATSGQVLLLDEAGEVDSKYVVIAVSLDYNAHYIYHLLTKDFPEFFHAWQTGLNFQIDKFDYLTLTVHDRAKQDEISQTLRDLETYEDYIQERIDFLVAFKAQQLRRVFPE